MRAARTKGKVLCGGQEVMFFPYLSAGLHRQTRRFDGVKQRVRSLNIRYGIVYPAKLRQTINGQTLPLSWQQLMTQIENWMFLPLMDLEKDSTQPHLRGICLDHKLLTEVGSHEDWF
ncbi:unnamed protein product [Pleuronectes platessa]|uniref:Uncharacterized protein n=1 Tax=Pleuronectes platessa TaxID=8262 RepID=A0A9N7USN8_PLEPL|nr:unnamed protein product [Pleuronectes platessa]